MDYVKSKINYVHIISPENNQRLSVFLSGKNLNEDTLKKVFFCL